MAAAAADGHPSAEVTDPRVGAGTAAKGAIALLIPTPSEALRAFLFLLATALLALGGGALARAVPTPDGRYICHEAGPTSGGAYDWGYFDLAGDADQPSPGPAEPSCARPTTCSRSREASSSATTGSAPCGAATTTAPR